LLALSLGAGLVPMPLPDEFVVVSEPGVWIVTEVDSCENHPPLLKPKNRTTIASSAPTMSAISVILVLVPSSVAICVTSMTAHEGQREFPLIVPPVAAWRFRCRHQKRNRKRRSRLWRENRAQRQLRRRRRQRLQSLGRASASLLHPLLAGAGLDRG